tara:strand:- start:47 stop:349 length:303 start_codon:yes stop_codon:yes gene_type:complete
MANRCFLYVAESGTDQICLDSDRVQYIRNTDATTVVIGYADTGGAAKAITLGVTSGKADEVLKEIGRIVLQGVGVITLADDVKSIYAVDGVEEVDSITHE